MHDFALSDSCHAKSFSVYFCGQAPVSRIELSCPRGKRRISARLPSKIFHGDRKIRFLQFRDWIFAQHRTYSHVLTHHFAQKMRSSPKILPEKESTVMKKNPAHHNLVEILPLTHLDKMVEWHFMVFHHSQSQSQSPLTLRNLSKVSDRTLQSLPRCRKLLRSGVSRIVIATSATLCLHVGGFCLHWILCLAIFLCCLSEQCVALNSWSLPILSFTANRGW